MNAESPAAYVELDNAYSRNGNPTAALSSLEDYLRPFPNDRNRKVIEDAAKKLRESISKTKPCFERSFFCKTRSSRSTRLLL